MVIYREYLFIENFTAGFLILLLTARMAGRNPGHLRILAASVLAGISGFEIFLPAAAAASGILRLATGIVICLTAFGMKQVIKTAVIFIINTFLASGAVIALLIWKQEPAITHQGIFYMDAVTYLRLICAGIIAFGIVYFFVKMIRCRVCDINLKGDVNLTIGGSTYVLRAFVDSGNGLREPVTGKPVILVDETGASKLPFKASDMKERYRIVPYRAVGISAGSLEAVRTDEIIFGEHKIRGAYIAFYQGRFGEYEALMNRDFLEGGLLQNG